MSWLAQRCEKWNQSLIPGSYQALRHSQSHLAFDHACTEVLPGLLRGQIKSLFFKQKCKRMEVNLCLVFMGFKYFYLEKHPNILVAAQNRYFFFASTTNIFWKYTSLADHAPTFQIKLSLHAFLWQKLSSCPASSTLAHVKYLISFNN